MLHTSELELLSNSAALGTPIACVLFNNYGDDWVDWDAVTVEMELRDDGLFELPSRNRQRIAALQVLLDSGSFFRDYAAFSSVCNTLLEGNPLFDVFDPVTPEEIGWALIETALLRDVLNFSPNLVRYTSFVLKDRGIDTMSWYPFSIMRKSIGDDQLVDVEPTIEYNDMAAFFKETTNMMFAQTVKLPGGTDKLRQMINTVGSKNHE
jgi:hypothetical protein